MSAFRRFLRRLAAPFRSTQAEHDLAREIRLASPATRGRFLAQGMSPDEARFAAQRAFGGVEQAKEHQRDARAFRWMDDSRIDFKLGARMLVKYPGLSLIGGIGLAAAIAIGAASFALIYCLHLRARYPSKRAIASWRSKTGTSRSTTRSAARCTISWRGANELRTVEELSAFRTIGRNLIVPGGTDRARRRSPRSRPSAFAFARVPPMLGRVSSSKKMSGPARGRCS